MRPTEPGRWVLADPRPDEIAAAVESLVLAFEADPHMAFLFPVGADERRNHVREFFAVLIAVRIALNAPVKVIRQEGSALGVVMGYSTVRQPWPVAWQERWLRLQVACPGAADRFATSDAASARFEPQGPHYYLGVVGLHPSLRGRGAGAALVRGFCGISDSDSQSGGTYIETCNPENVPFYQRCGFLLRGQQALDDVTTLHCLFRPAMAGSSNGQKP